jgi:hypothetical protein
VCKEGFSGDGNNCLGTGRGGGGIEEKRVIITDSFVLLQMSTNAQQACWCAATMQIASTQLATTTAFATSITMVTALHAIV